MKEKYSFREKGEEGNAVFTAQDGFMAVAFDLTESGIKAYLFA